MNSRIWTGTILFVVLSLVLVLSGCGADTPVPTATSEPEAKIGEPYGTRRYRTYRI